VGGTIKRRRTDKLLNHQTNDEADRKEAAFLLVDYVINFRKENSITDEEVTLIGYSHGGNVATLAGKILYDKYGIKINLITINTPAYTGKSDIENPLNHPAVNDMITFWTPEDQVAGGLAGSDHHEENAKNPRNQVIPLEPRDEVGGMYSDHFLENVDPNQLKNSDAQKLKPVEKKKK
jgi:hypothetical protein